MITYFKDKNNKSKKKYEKFKMLSTIFKSFDTIVIIAKTSSSVTLSLTGVGLLVKPISTGIARWLTNSNIVLYEIIRKNIINTKNVMEKIDKQLNPLIIYTENHNKIT